MERLEISVACRNYYGGIWLSFVPAKGQTETRGFGRIHWETTNHTAAWNSMSEDWVVVEAGDKRHLPGRY